MNITLIKYSLVCNASKEHCLHLLIEYTAQMQITSMQYVHGNHQKKKIRFFQFLNFFVILNTTYRIRTE